MHLRDHQLPIQQRTCIMGILNVTPDSFSGEGIYKDPRRALEKAEQLVSEGADIIDIGGESSRPGAEEVSEEEELSRVIPVIEAIKRSLNVPVSIDTYKSQVARMALEAGAEIVNDITALTGDSSLAAVIAEFDAAVILMHMKGTPGNMQCAPSYDNVIEEIYSFLDAAVSKAENKGISPDKIIIDPGIGFGKTLRHNVEILAGLNRFKKLGKPVLIGASRKSFIGEITGRKTNERMFGTAASSAVAIMNGADILRVHDVGAACDAARVTDAIIGGK